MAKNGSIQILGGREGWGFVIPHFSNTILAISPSEAVAQISNSPLVPLYFSLLLFLVPV